MGANAPESGPTLSEKAKKVAANARRGSAERTAFIEESGEVCIGETLFS